MFKFRKLIKVVSLVLMLLFIFIGCTNNQNLEGSLEVSIIDVGQGDAIFIKTPNNKNILIDTGSKNDKDKLYNFLKEKNIKNIDVLIGTHPHEDHIGNMASIIKDYTIGEIYMPKINHTTKTFKDTILAVKEKNLTIKSPKSGQVLEFGGAKMEFLAPNSEKYKDLNDYSIVSKISYGKNSFMLMGDAEKVSEKEIISKGYNLKSDVIKLGHHGSSTSSSKEFIKLVDPKFAVASCGKNNEYGHPHKEIVKLLSSFNIELYKTFETGNITFISDGENLKVGTKNNVR